MFNIITNNLFLMNVFISIDDFGSIANACIIIDKPENDKPSADKITFKVGLLKVLVSFRPLVISKSKFIILKNVLFIFRYLVKRFTNIVNINIVPNITTNKDIFFSYNSFFF